MRQREDLIYVGIELHKETHTAVILSRWNEKSDEIAIAKKPSEFRKLETKMKKYLTDGREAMYGPENAYGYGPTLAV